MRSALVRYDTLLKEAIESHEGRIVKTTGDGLHAVFESPTDAVVAALVGQQAFSTEAWADETGPLKVRMGLHTGESQEREWDYSGPEVNLAAWAMGTTLVESIGGAAKFALSVGKKYTF